MSYLDLIARDLIGKEVEVYAGDVRTTMYYADHEIQNKNVIRGIINEISNDCLILECGNESESTRVYLSGAWIKLIIPMEDPLFVKDVFREEDRRKKHK